MYQLTQILLFLHTKVIIHGRLTEWLGSGLQNRLRRFESATDLNQSLSTKCQGFFVFIRDRLAEVKDENKKDLSGAQRHRDWLTGPPKPDHANNPPPTSTNP
jgi:hypothetical protein